MKFLDGKAGLRARAVMRDGSALLMGLAVLAAQGQTPAGTGTGPHAGNASAQMLPVQEPVAREVVREIDDPHTGAHWLLLRDASHPGGPGRLLQVEGAGHQVAQEKAEVEPSRAELRPVLRAGDRLIVEENTPRVEARFEAVALGPAERGSVFSVRLTIGGKVVRAVALGPGHATLQPGTEARP